MSPYAASVSLAAGAISDEQVAAAIKGQTACSSSTRQQQPRPRRLTASQAATLCASDLKKRVTLEVDVSMAHLQTSEGGTGVIIIIIYYYYYFLSSTVCLLTK